ncbi:MAG TPA: oxygenase MpaB family protein [Gemmatimonadaceae bacterium]
MTQPSTTTPTEYTASNGAPTGALSASRRSSAMASKLGASRWSNDAFLDGLRQFGDGAADRCAIELSKTDNSAAVARAMFAGMTQNDQRLPADAPAPLRAFFDETYAWCHRCRQPALPAWVDRDRVIRGQTVFMERLIPSVLVLLCKSLPEGYAAAGATKILNISGELLAHTYHRLMGTLQLLVNVSSPQSFERSGVALLNAQQMRLLHAGVRSNVAPKVLDRRAGEGGYQAYLARYGMPINQEDLLATIMAFSLLVVRGLRMLHVPLTDAEAEDFYYVWRVFAHLMGIHPPDDSADESHLPETLAEASDFYAAYCRRHYAGETKWAEGWRERSLMENPDGCALAERHLNMLATVLPDGGSRFFDLADVTHIYVEMLIGEEACARVGIPRLEGHPILRFSLMHLPRWWSLVWNRVNGGIHVKVSDWFLRTLLQASYKRGVVFTVPSTLEDLKALVEDGASSRGSMAMEAKS